MVQTMKKWISNLIDWFLHTLLTEDQKKRLSSLIPERYKQIVRKITKYGKRRQQKLYVKKIKDNLYSLGLRNKSLAQLESILQESNDEYLQRLVAWELTLWYANLETKEGAKRALTYIDLAKNGENDITQLRRITIVEAECLARLDRKDEARQIITEQLEREEHPDLFLSLANLEEDVQKRLTYLNQIYRKYNLNPITFSSYDEATYDELTMKDKNEPIDHDVKVTVILPAYNAGEGLRVAVESILQQTWRNLELIIVDDCSTDNTLAIAQEYAEKDERVIVKQTEQNSGPYVARNIALQIATGYLVTVNDADDWSHEDKIKIQAEHLIKNPDVIANTSAHARLTEELYFYRRGTPGRYIFPNMSSTMFRREQVMEKLGFWDSVRFSADGEFKRRLINAFGEQAFVDLESGPLSLPRQAAVSLTSGSPFGYNGFFMGARKEYVESFQHYYKEAENYYYPFPQKERLFPVPEPMWPSREDKIDGKRQFDVVIVADFRKTGHIEEVLKQLLTEKVNEKIGLMQWYEYNLQLPIEIANDVRHLLNDYKAQMLVYGEKVTTEKLIVLDYTVLEDEQTYIPEINSQIIEILVTENNDLEKLQQAITILRQQYAKEVIVKPSQENVREQIEAHWPKDKPFQLANENWVS